MKSKYIDKGIKENNQKTSDWLFYGLLLFFVFEYLRPGSYLPILYTLKINTVIPVFVFVFSLFLSGGPGTLEIVNAKNTRWLLSFLFLFFLSALTADVTYYVYIRFLAILGYILAYFAMVKIINIEKRLATLFALLVIIHIILLVLNPDVILHPESRHYLAGVTFLGDGNDFALSSCIVIPFAIYLFQAAENKLKRILLLSILGFLIFAVIGTQSRGGFIALSAVFLYFWVKSEKKIQILVMAVVIAVIVGIFTPTEYFERIQTIKDYETEGSAQGRIMAWKSAVRMALDHPILGVGAGHFPVKYGVEYRPPGVDRTDIPWSTAHSIYFLILGEFGFPGIIFLVGIILFNIRRSDNTVKMLEKGRSGNTDKYKKLTIAMNCSMVGFAVGSAFLSTLYYPHLYVLAALFESANRICSGKMQAQ
jgi:probable O-glycosylation ligase (exosortase A-associated)